MSRPKKPTTGHAPISQKANPAVKEHATSAIITSMKPVALSDRWGFSTAAKIGFSSGSAALPELMLSEYREVIAKS